MWVVRGLVIVFGAWLLWMAYVWRSFVQEAERSGNRISGIGRLVLFVKAGGYAGSGAAWIVAGAIRAEWAGLLAASFLLVAALGPSYVNWVARRRVRTPEA